MKTLKRAMALIFVLMLSINSFAVNVSDNDGSAFITKAEFDSLKNSFQNQIDQYNTSIDSKIDNAIAAYLAGILTTKKITLVNYITAARSEDVAHTGFVNPTVYPEDTKDVYDVSAGFLYMDSAGPSNHDKYHGYALCNNYAAWGGGLTPVRYTNFTGSTANYTSRYIWIKKVDDSKSPWYLNDYIYHRLHFDLTTCRTQWSYACRDNDFGLSKTFNPTVSCTQTQPSTTTVTVGGIGGFTNIQTHLWEDVTAKTIYGSDTYTLALDLYKYNVSCLREDYLDGVYYDVRDYYNSSQGQVSVQIQRLKEKVAEQGGDPGVNNYIKYNDGDATASSGTSNNIKFIWKYYIPKKGSFDLRKLENYYWHTIMDETYYKYYGIPITKTTKKGKLKFKLKFTSSKGKKFAYSIKDTQYDNSNVLKSSEIDATDVTVNHVLKYATNISSGEINLELDKKKIADTKGDYIYIKVVPNDNTDVVFVEVVGDIVNESDT